MTEKLTDAERDSDLQPLLDQGWEMVEGRDAIRKVYKFKGFVQAFGWMTQGAIHAQVMNHHPEWSNVYNTVTVTLTTHDVDGLSPLDIKLARKMDTLTP